MKNVPGDSSKTLFVDEKLPPPFFFKIKQQVWTYIESLSFLKDPPMCRSYTHVGSFLLLQI